MGGRVANEGRNMGRIGVDGTSVRCSCGEEIELE